MEVFKSYLWILTVPAVFLTSGVMVKILMLFFVQGDVVSFDFALRILGVVAVLLSAAVIFLRLGIRLKPLNQADASLIVAFAIGAVLVIYG